jgi:hypothetical protein
MAGSSKITTAAKGKRPPTPKPANDRDELSVTDLARGVLSKEIRPRVTDVRRLAEAVLAGGSAKPKKAAKKDKAADGKKKDKGKKKLAKIPGPRAKK